MSGFNKHSKNADKQHYAFRVDLSSAQLFFDPKNPAKFTIIADPEKADSHTWAHFNGDRGNINSKTLTQALSNSYEKDKSETSKFRIGSIPYSAFNNLDGVALDGSAMLFESKKIKHEEGKIIWKGKLLSTEYISEHREMLQGGFGIHSVHNHLRFNPTKYFSMEKSPYPSTGNGLKRSGPALQRRTDMGEAYGENAGPLNWGIPGIPISIPTPPNPIPIITKPLSSWGNDIKGGFGTALGGIESAANATVNFGKDAGAVVVNAANKVYDALVKERDFKFGLDWPKLDANKTLPDPDVGPLKADLSIQPELSGDLALKSGVIGALDPDSIALELSPSVKFDGSIDLIQPGASYDKTFTLFSKSLPISDPPIIDGGSFAINVGVKLDAALEDKALNLGAEMTFTPGATITLGGTNAGLQNISAEPIFTTKIPKLGSEDFDPEVDFTATLTPELVATIGATIPKKLGGDDIPFIGGTGLADVKTTLSNPVELAWKSSDPTQITVSTSGKLDSNAEFLGATVTPEFADKTLYGPLADTITF